jgi:hypothetical protein
LIGAMTSGSGQHENLHGPATLLTPTRSAAGMPAATRNGDDKSLVSHLDLCNIAVAMVLLEEPLSFFRDVCMQTHERTDQDDRCERRGDRFDSAPLDPPTALPRRSKRHAEEGLKVLPSGRMNPLDMKQLS